MRTLKFSTPDKEKRNKFAEYQKKLDGEKSVNAGVNWKKGGARAECWISYSTPCIRGVRAKDKRELSRDKLANAKKGSDTHFKGVLSGRGDKKNRVRGARKGGGVLKYAQISSDSGMSAIYRGRDSASTAKGI